MLPTGALLLLNFSNQTVFDFLNPKSTFSTTLLNFSAVQPLLQGGGQAVALESLTQAERNLLYQIRTFARFRKQLYVEIASNSGGSINGSSFQPVGVLSNTSGGTGGLGNSGLNPGVLPTVMTVATTISGPILPPSSPGTLNLSPAITPAPSGYLNTMLQSIQVYIDKENIDVLSIILQRYRGLLEGDVVGPLQVQNVEQQLLTGRANLLNDQQDYLQSLDQFKIEIGVPMNLEHRNGRFGAAAADQAIQTFAGDHRRRTGRREGSLQTPRFGQSRRGPQRIAPAFPARDFVRGTPFASTIAESPDDLGKAVGPRNSRRRLEANPQGNPKTAGSASRLCIVKEQSLSPADQARLKDLGSDSDLGNYERVLRLYEATYLENGKPKKARPDHRTAAHHPVPRRDQLLAKDPGRSPRRSLDGRQSELARTAAVAVLRESIWSRTICSMSRTAAARYALPIVWT